MHILSTASDYREKKKKKQQLSNYKPFQIETRHAVFSVNLENKAAGGEIRGSVEVENALQFSSYTCIAIET